MTGGRRAGPLGTGAEGRAPTGAGPGVQLPTTPHLPASPEFPGHRVHAAVGAGQGLEHWSPPDRPHPTVPPAVPIRPSPPSRPRQAVSPHPVAPTSLLSGRCPGCLSVPSWGARPGPGVWAHPGHLGPRQRPELPIPPPRPLPLSPDGTSASPRRTRTVGLPTTRLGPGVQCRPLPLPGARTQAAGRRFPHLPSPTTARPTRRNSGWAVRARGARPEDSGGPQPRGADTGPRRRPLSAHGGASLPAPPWPGPCSTAAARLPAGLGESGRAALTPAVEVPGGGGQRGGPSGTSSWRRWHLCPNPEMGREG